jgi:hypothetical protein
MTMRYLSISLLFLALAPVAHAQYPDPRGMGNLEQERQEQQTRQRNYQQEQERQWNYQQEQTRQRNYQQERQQERQRYEQERKQAEDDAIRRERAIQSERRGEPAPGRPIYRFGR